MNPQDHGCRDPWCLQYRAGLARRADLAETALRSAQRQIGYFQAQQALATLPPEPPAPRNPTFRLSRWVLFGVILIVLGCGITTAALLAENVMSNTTFYEGP